MKPEQQRIAIAEACGLIVHFDKGNPEPYYFKSPGFKFYLPDYLNDLNAMHEAENMLQDCEIKWSAFQNHLWRAIEPHRHALHATAAQRAEAFLRTLNLWTGSLRAIEGAIS